MMMFELKMFKNLVTQLTVSQGKRKKNNVEKKPDVQVSYGHWA